MTDATPDVLAERLDRLERENRRLKRLVYGALLGIAAVAVMGQAPSSIVRVFEAEKFVLHGPDGQIRAELGVETNGESALRLYPEKKGGKAELMLAVTADGQARLQLADDAGLPRAVMGHVAIVTTATGAVEERPSSSLVLSDKEGKVVWKAPQ